MKSELEKFIQWTTNYEEFEKVDWNYYRKQPDWEKSFRNWNKLRNDRLDLLAEWQNKK